MKKDCKNLVKYLLIHSLLCIKVVNINFLMVIIHVRTCLLSFRGFLTEIFIQKTHIFQLFSFKKHSAILKI